MQYSPRPQKRSFFAVLVTGILFIVSPAMGQAFPTFKTVFSAAAQIFFLSLLWLCARFLLPRFYYRLDETHFTVIRIIGKRMTVLCRLPLQDLISVTSAVPESSGKKRKCLNACKNIFPHPVCHLLFDDADREILITIESDDLLIQALHTVKTQMKTEVNHYDP